MTQEQSKMIDLEHILYKQPSPLGVEVSFTINEKKVILKAMREAIRQALELAAENGKLEYRSYNINGRLINSEEAENEVKVGIYDYVGVSKQSIISVNELVK